MRKIVQLAPALRTTFLHASTAGSLGSATGSLIVFFDWQTPRISVLYKLRTSNGIGVVFN